MLPFSPKLDLEFSDIVTEAIILLGFSIYFFSMWKSPYALGSKRAWVIVRVGIGVYVLGAALDLFDEFYKLPQVIPRVIENGLLAVGVILFSFGILASFRQLTELASIDALTGLQNRRSLIEILTTELQRAQRYEYPVSVAFLDIDGFKRVNDLLGHIQGDNVLKSITEFMKTSIRTSDTLARFGGDELVLVMPETDLDSAEVLLKRLQQGVFGLHLPGGIQIGISYGIAGFPVDGNDMDDLVNLANKRMYESRASTNQPA